MLTLALPWWRPLWRNVGQIPTLQVRAGLNILISEFFRHKLADKLTHLLPLRHTSASLHQTILTDCQEFRILQDSTYTASLPVEHPTYYHRDYCTYHGVLLPHHLPDPDFLHFHIISLIGQSVTECTLCPVAYYHVANKMSLPKPCSTGNRGQVSSRSIGIRHKWSQWLCRRRPIQSASRKAVVLARSCFDPRAFCSPA